MNWRTYMDDEEEIYSQVTEVIETTQGTTIRYFTKSGVFIGEIKAGVRTKTPTVQEKKKNFTGVVKSYTPTQIRRKQDREAASLLNPKNKLQQLKEDVV